MNWLMMPEREMPLRESESMARVGSSISGLDRASRSGNLEHGHNVQLYWILGITLYFCKHVRSRSRVETFLKLVVW